MHHAFGHLRAGRPGDLHRHRHVFVLAHQRHRRLLQAEGEKLPRQQTDGASLVDPGAAEGRPPPISDKPPALEPRQVSMPAAVRPGATTVGGVINRFVEVVLAGLVILMADEAPDVLPSVWAYTGEETTSAVNTINARIAEVSDLLIYLHIHLNCLH